MARELRTQGVTVVGVNEDVVAADALAFIEELGGVAYPILAGRGRQRARYHYRGLPYTVIVDREGRVIRTLYGFGSSIAPIETVVHRELGGRQEAGRPMAPTPANRSGVGS